VNKREKILAAVVGGILVVVILHTIVNGMFLAPADQLAKDIRETKNKIKDLNRTAKSMKANESRLEKFAARTYGSDEEEIKNRVFGRLMKLLDRSGLGSEGKVVKTPDFDHKRDYTEVSWSVDKSGKIEHILNLLYLIDSDPTLHRVENLVITPRHRDGTFNVQFRYVALSLATKNGKQFTATQPAETVVAAKLNSPKRLVYEAVARRDIFRPYIKRAPKPVVTVSKPPSTPTRTTPPPPTPPAKAKPKYRICGLPKLGGRPEVWVINDIDTTAAVKKYKEGQKLLGWEIVMIDYRRLPDPGKPGLFSAGRVILRSDTDYWAVEGGQYVDDMRLLIAGELPPSLAAGSTGPVHP